jgi:hypothetical protein
MELTLMRTRYPDGTNGDLFADDFVCHSIELPWRENLRNVSCIPDGKYKLAKRYTEERGMHLEVMDVPGRTGILIHPANESLRELRGCIAPVTTLIGAGRGIHSRKATTKLEDIVFTAMKNKEEVYLTIKSN